MESKALFLMVVLGFAVCGCSTAAVNADAEIGPKLEEIKDPNPFANYGPAMASDKAHPMAYEWQSAHEAEVAAATTPETLAAFVADEAAALKLLGGVKGAYATDPLLATQVAAVTQLVMTPGCAKAAAARPIWVAALEKTQAAATDDYVRSFCAQQLRLCK